MGSDCYDEGGTYRLRVRGQLDGDWSEWLDGLTVTPGADGTSLIAGYIPDQAALHGLLVKIRDMGLPLVFLARQKE